VTPEEKEDLKILGWIALAVALAMPWLFQLGQVYLDYVASYFHP
jgi:hypothetical protein